MKNSKRSPLKNLSYDSVFCVYIKSCKRKCRRRNRHESAEITPPTDVTTKLGLAAIGSVFNPVVDGLHTAFLELRFYRVVGEYSG